MITAADGFVANVGARLNDGLTLVRMGTREGMLVWLCTSSIGLFGQDAAVPVVPDTMKVYSLDQVTEVPEYLTAAGVACSPADRVEGCSPKGATDDCERQTKVIVSFIVERDGRVSSPAIKRSSCKALEDAAMCHVSGMRPWKPARIGKVPVRTCMVLLIQYEVR